MYIGNLSLGQLIKYIDIQALLEDLRIDIVRKAGDSVVCHCISPRHSDSTPSMYIDIYKGIWHCFGCGAKGHILDLISQVSGRAFPENKEYLVKFSSVEYITRSQAIDDIESGKVSYVGDRSKTVNCISRGSQPILGEHEYEEINYPPGTEIWTKEVYEWCSRAIVDFNSIRQYFSLGYCVWAKYSGRVIIPIWFKGKFVNFQARDCNGTLVPKDLYVYGVSVGNCLFNYDNIHWEYPVVVVEGLIDVLRLWPYYTNTVSVFGSNMSDTHALLLGRAKKIYIIPDDDEGGDKLLLGAKDKLQNKELWTTKFDKKDIPNLMSKAVRC